jgi:peptide/nickel transport system permease protein
MKEVLYYIKKNKLAYLSLYILGILYFLAVFADFISPYPYDLQHRDTPYHPPTQIHFIDEKGKFHIRPFVYEYTLLDPVLKTYKVNYEKKHHIYFFIDGEKHYLFGIIPTTKHLFGVKEGKIFLLGADNLGRDIFSRLLYGARISLSIGIIGVLLSFTIGAVIGGISGYYGGKIDNILIR